MAENEAARILVVEDDPSILLGLRINLENEGYVVETATDGAQGLAIARAERWDLIVLDIMLPKLNGYEFVCALRADKNATPILVLSARTSEVDKIMGLDLGADDYMTKPFSVGELLARIRVVLRRDRGEQSPSWSFGDVQVNPATREITKLGEKVDLTVTEFDILAALIRCEGRVLTRDQIMDTVWGQNHFGTPRTIDNFIAQLRAKLEEDPANPAHLLTVRGVGYRFAG